MRWEDPLIGRAIAEGVARSSTFRNLVDAVATTDGLVYVLEGQCEQGVRACLHMSVEISGQYRLLRILVNPRRASGCELIESIGHELQTRWKRFGIRAFGMALPCPPSSLRSVRKVHGSALKRRKPNAWE